MTKRAVLRAAGVVALLCVAYGAWWSYRLVWGRPANIDHFFERVFIEFALQEPELLSRLRILEPYGLRFHNDDLTPVSDEFAAKRLADVKRNLALLRAYDRDALSPQQRRSADVLEYFLDDLARGERFRFHTYPVNQLGGVQNELPEFLTEIHQVNDATDAEQYIARLEKVPWKLGQALDAMREREARGILPPRFVIQRVLAEMREFVAGPVEEHVLYTSFSKKLAEVDTLDDAARAELLRKATRAIDTAVLPAYRKLIDYCEALEPKCGTDDGVWHLPDGDAFYAYKLRSQTTSELSPDEVHEIGLREVARIQAEIVAILEQEGMGDVPVGDALARLADDERFLYPDTAEGRAACIADFQAIVDDIDAHLTGFNLRPESGVRVEPVPAFRAAGAPGGYYNPPAMDGSRPGIFYANLHDMAGMPKFSMRTLAYHEAIPGHHFQVAIQQELRGVPTFRRVLPFTAYVEGWALYAERVAWEQGFEADPFDNLGRLQSELFRAVRLVVDTGLHAKHWTREQAIEYMRTTTGNPEVRVVAEIERYIVDPGQACAYKLGELKILELRERARAALGDRFRLADFHDVVLRNGALPLPLLEREVDAWIAEAG